MKDLIAELKENNVAINLKGEHLEIKFDGVLETDLLIKLKNNKQDLISLLKSHSIENQFSDIPALEKADHYAISNAQKRLWILGQYEGGSVAYNLPNTAELFGDYDKKIFDKAIGKVIDRHEILRTVFKEDESGEIRQWIVSAENFNFEIDFFDLRNQENKKAKLSNYISEDAYKAFDLESGPLLRISLLQLEDRHFVLYYNVHHIISDGWSMDVLINDVKTYYESLKMGVPVALPKLQIHYKDYAAWQQERLINGTLEESKAYWLEYLSGTLPLLNLPISKPRPKVFSYQGKAFSTLLDRDLTAKLKAYCQNNGGTLFMGLLSVWNVLLYRYTNENDFIVGSPVSGRDHSDLSNQIGFYVNTIVHRNKLKGSDTFESFFQTVKTNTLASLNHQEYPFDELVNDLDFIRDTSRNVVFDTMLTVQNTSKRNDDALNKKEDFSEISEGQLCREMFDISLDFEEIADYLSFRLSCNTAIYEDQLVTGMMNHFKELLKNLLTFPTQKIDTVNMLSSQEKYKLQVDFNDTKIDYPKKTILDAFRENVDQDPNAVALIYGGDKISFGQLNSISNQVGNYLISQGVTSGELIPICMDRSFEMLFGIIGILKAGGAYVPIVPEYPQSRIDYILEDTAARIAVVSEKHSHKIDTKKVICLDTFPYNSYSSENLNVSIDKEQTAYCIYTSGTTGNPKGVLNSYEGLWNKLMWTKDYLKITSESVLFQKTPCVFDVSVWEFTMPLLTGCKLVIAKPDGHFDLEYMQEVIIEEGVSHIEFVPSLIDMLLESLDEKKLKSLKHVFSGGDVIFPSTLSKFQKLLPRVKIHNTYGPTEAAIDVTAIDITSLNSDLEVISIGKPIANNELYIVNESLELQPIGVSGELIIGGIQVAKGYLNKPELTKEKFVKNIFTGEGNLYKTGDLCKWRLDGTIEFLGRIDNQVKVNGHRIELEEIESSLSTLDFIKSNVVVLIEQDSGEKALVAYITSDKDVSNEKVREKLSENLPSYMLPSYFVQLKELPLTVNGKIDRKALPIPDAMNSFSSIKYVAPRNKVEVKLVSIWEEVLQRENIGIEDVFFDLGGHSLKAMRLINEYYKSFEVKISLNTIFSHDTIAAQSKIIIDSQNECFIEIPKVPIKEDYPISNAQRRLWILSQFKGGSSVYNMPTAVVLNGDYNLQSFEKAVCSVIERHEILRTVFKENSEGEIRQSIIDVDAMNFKMVYKDFRKSASLASSYMEEDAMVDFDLEKGPLIRAAILQTSDQEYVFYYNMHHIISDGWSMEVLSQDVLHYYEAYANNLEPKLEQLRIQYKDYSSWQLSQLDTDISKESRDYWLEKLSVELPDVLLPGAKQRPAVRTHKGGGLTTYLDKELTALLSDFSRANGGSLFISLLSTFSILLYRYTQEKNIVLGSPVAGRDHIDLKDQIGFYVNTLAFLNQIHPAEDFTSFYHRVKQNTLEAYDHQMYPFDRLVEELNVIKDTSRNAIFDIMLVLQNNAGNKGDINFGKTKLDHIEEYSNVASKFDLQVTFEEVGDYLSFNLVYNKDVYSASMLKNLIGHYKQLLSSLLTNPSIAIDQIDYLAEEEKKELLGDFNDVDYPKDKTIVDFFEDQVRRRPDAIAVSFQKCSFTYQEIECLSNQFAHFLVDDHAITPGDFVSLTLERSEWLIVSILGILKIGATYVPIDPDSPVDRISFIKKDCNSKKHINQDSIESFRNKMFSSEKRTVSIRPEDLAYVIYTSGSTGKPKGVMVSHLNVVRLFFNEESLFDFNNEDVWCLFHSYAFDFSIWEIFGALLNGGQIVIPTKLDVKDPILLSNLLCDHRVTVFNQTPSSFQSIHKLLIDSRLDFAFRYIIFGGEALYPFYLKEWSDLYPDCKLINMYGITEITVHTTYKEISSKDIGLNISTIGKSLPTSKSYILDANYNLVPFGVVGEIHIGGAGLASGYLNRPELTNDRFISNPFTQGEKLYRTGDLGRWLQDGNIEYIGRKDDQVKVRGYRIELGEISYALSQIANIDANVVLAKDGESGKVIIAYVTSKDILNVNYLREELRKSLPDYMLPSYFVQLQELPLTVNGKVDRKNLPAPQTTEMSSGIEYVAPRTDLEKSMVAHWENILDKTGIGIDDDFFNLGGNSLKAIRASKFVNTVINLRSIYEHRTVREILKHVDETNFKNNDGLIHEYYQNSNKTKNIILFPYAGAINTMFFPLANELSSDFNVYIVSMPWNDWQNDSEPRSLDWIKETLVNEVVEKIKGDTFLFGHCAGSSLAVYLSHELKKLMIPLKGLFIGGTFYERAKKHLRFTGNLWAKTSNEEIYNWLLGLGMKNDDLEEDMRDKMLRSFKLDSEISTVFGSINETNRQKLNVPIHCIYGTDDPITSNYGKHYKKWRKHSRDVSYSEIQNAKHYFVNYNYSETSKIILEEVNRLYDTEKQQWSLQ